MEFISYIIQKIINAAGLNHFDYKVLIFYFSIVIGGFVIELVFIGWKNSSIKRLIQFDKSIRTDLISWALEAFNLHKLIALFLSFGICYILVALIERLVNLQLIHHIQNPYLQFLIVFIFSDFKNYFRHIVFHRINPLWKIHEFHHSATTMSVLTRYRGHFLETSISTFFDVIPLIILGIPLQTFFAVKIFTETHQVLIHSSLRSDWGLIGRYILVSPAAHRIHHSTNSQHFLKNYGSTLIIWDRLFGTYHPYEKVEEVGLPENPYNHKGYIHDVLLSIKLAVKTFKR